jgi:hypothetical protein
MEWVLSLCFQPDHVMRVEFVSSKPHILKTIDELPVELLCTISVFIDDPVTYFRLRQVNRKFYTGIQSQFTLSGTRLWDFRTLCPFPLRIELAASSLVITPPLCPDIVEYYKQNPGDLLNALQSLQSDREFVGLFQPPVIATEYFLAATVSHANDFGFLKKLAMVATSGHDIRMYHVFLNLARESHRAVTSTV